MTATLERDLDISDDLDQDEPQRVIVCGSRTWDDEDFIRAAMKEHISPGSLIIVGRSRGADQIAEDIAEEFDWPILPFEADWDIYGRSAGPMRNIRMLDEDPDRVIAFQDGESSGTSHILGEARKRGIPALIFRRDSDFNIRQIHMDNLV